MLELNKVYNMDCYKGIKLIKDNSIDLVIIDPPYILNKSKPGGCFKKVDMYLSKEYRELLDGFQVEVLFNEFKRVLKKFNLYVFCSVKQIHEILSFAIKNNYLYNILIWWKYNAILFNYNTWIPEIEYIIHIKENGATFNNNIKHYKLYRYPNNVNKENILHFTIKPDQIIEQFIKISSNKNDVVLDIFMGSGTTAVCCKRLDRNFIGFEIKKEYFNIINQRLKNVKKSGYWEQFS